MLLSLRSFASLTILALTLAACGAKQAPHQVASAGPTLSGGRESVDALISAGLDALAQRDTAALRSLAVTREEFERVILPTMGEKYPAARDTSTQAREFIADNHFRSSDKALRRALNDVAGVPLELKGVDFKEKSSFTNYILHEGTLVHARAADGVEKDIIVFGSVIEQGGVFKLLGFRDRD